MPETPALQSQWQALATAADEGHLFLDPDTAEACHHACVLFIEQLVNHQNEAKGLVDINGWGTFKAGQQLRQIYADKAFGGDNNMYDVLQSHIDVVTEMQAVFAKFFTLTGDNERQNALEIQQGN